MYRLYASKQEKKEIEFDWCAVNAVEATAAASYETIMLNYNRETVSTDYDVCDKLIFDEISLETVLDILDAGKPDGVVVSMGGHVPNNLAMRCTKPAHGGIDACFTGEVGPHYPFQSEASKNGQNVAASK